MSPTLAINTATPELLSGINVRMALRYMQWDAALNPKQ